MKINHHRYLNSVRPLVRKRCLVDGLVMARMSLDTHREEHLS